MQIFGRPLGRIVRAPFGPEHWIAGLNMFRVYDYPIDAAKRYILTLGRYPHTFRLKTPNGKIDVTAWSSHDVLTINEIFCRLDYRIEPGAQVVVDFGSNIGISALYFLAHAPDSFVYCFEPLPSNCERLKGTLANYNGRYCLSETAVAPVAGKANFGWEETGRYGGVGQEFPQQVVVDCLSAQDVIAGVLSAHGKIDILKIDIEGLEREVLFSLPKAQLEKIERIYAETDFTVNPLATTHAMRQYGSVVQFTRALPGY